MITSKNTSLKPYNTFGIDVKARYFLTLNNFEDVSRAFQMQAFQPVQKQILGGGSNLLFVKNFDGLVIKNNLKGIQVIEEDETHVWVNVGSGENWHEFVLWCIDHNYGGVENLSLIPGTVGAAPIQNIGAYGVELQEVFEHLEAYHILSDEYYFFNNAACEFGYRDSIFKNRLKDQFFILSVTLKLTKKHHNINTSYGAISDLLDKENITKPTLQDISNAVIKIRTSKLPNPSEIGNSGSFFKNPTISSDSFEKLKKHYPNLVGYPLDDNNIKVPAGWLIEQCGWKGKRVGNTGAYEKQALVLVNYGSATGQEVWNLAQSIQKSVYDKFGVSLETEVNIIH